ncbi:hypothetical protein AVEN_113398-1 [Araneus ventricosus]|uniref:Uncharacterized protein n=1 Tax=Araneus ventricosus TaxID=182803 RepID=A0A4Y2DEJ1_ARAVE|nr:hypothetical protein AVEN_113398-1 [Araneus ventricosus]
MKKRTCDHLDLSAPSAIIERGAQNADDVTVTPVVTKFSSVARALDLFGISDRVGAAIVSAVVQDVFIISESNVLNIVDRNKIRRERKKCLDKNEGNGNITLYVFCDASEKAYATCIFLRSEGDDSTDCQLIQARARGAPLKSISVSRLELLARPQDKRLRKLQILEDENGPFRIKKRLSLKEDIKYFKFPIVLPSEQSIVEKLVRWKHCFLGHADVQIVIEVFTSPDGNIGFVKLKTKSGEILRPTLRPYPLGVSEHEKELFQKCERPVKTFTCDDSSAAERDSLDKAEPDKPTSR